MAAVKYRENTFKVELSNFSKRPTFEQIHTFIHESIGLKLEHVVRLQMNHAQNCAHVKCVNLNTALDAVAHHSDKHELECNGEKLKVRLVMDDCGLEVKLHDLSENISEHSIKSYLSQYGEVLSVKELCWGENFAFKGIPTGVRVAKIRLQKHIRSFVTIEGEQTLVTYRNQPQTCRHCTNIVHPGLSCVQNRTLLGQKTSLDKRLQNARKQSYASAIKNTIPSKSSLSMLLADKTQSSDEQTKTAEVPRENSQTTPVENTADDNQHESANNRETQPCPNKSNTPTVDAIETTIHSQDSTSAASAVAAQTQSNNGRSRMQRTVSDNPLDGNKQVCEFKTPIIPTDKIKAMEISDTDSGDAISDVEATAAKRARANAKRATRNNSRNISPVT